jgi:hypothetical protein
MAGKAFVVVVGTNAFEISHKLRILMILMVNEAAESINV